MPVTKSVWPTPDNSLSGENGTRMVPWKPLLSAYPFSRPTWFKSSSNDHLPFRLTQSVLSNCGLGYSGLGIFSPAATLMVAPKTRRAAAMNCFTIFFILNIIYYLTLIFNEYSRVLLLCRGINDVRRIRIRRRSGYTCPIPLSKRFGVPEDRHDASSDSTTRLYYVRTKGTPDLPQNPNR